MKKFEKKMKNLFKKEGLDDNSIFFAEYDTFEEIPLYSRWKNISFLDGFSFDEKNKVLINSCLRLVTTCKEQADFYLGEENASSYFVCATLTGWDDYDEINCLNVNVFVSRRKEWLLNNLKLSTKNSPEEEITSSYLKSLSYEDFEVLCANEFESNKRVFIVNKEFEISKYSNS